jgi:hypothetical protein
MPVTKKRPSAYEQAEFFPVCRKCGVDLAEPTAKECVPCRRARTCYPCGGRKRAADLLCGSCAADLAAWRRAFPEPVRPPSFRWPPGHLARLRARARRRLPLFGGARQKRMTVRELIEAVEGCVRPALGS